MSFMNKLKGLGLFIADGTCATGRGISKGAAWIAKSPVGKGTGKVMKKAEDRYQKYQEKKLEEETAEIKKFEEVVAVLEGVSEKTEELLAKQEETPKGE